MKKVKINTPFYAQLKEYLKQELENFKTWNPKESKDSMQDTYKLNTTDTSAAWIIRLEQDHMTVSSNARYVYLRHGLKIDMQNERLEISGIESPL